MKKCPMTVKQLRRRLPLLLYAAALALWLIFAEIGFVTNRTGDAVELDLFAAKTEGLMLEALGQYVSENGDPKLVFEGILPKGYFNYIQLNAAFSAPPGELDVYYTSKEGQGFSPKKRAIAAPLPGGGWLYTLPPLTRVHSLRVDLGTVAENAVSVSGIVLNPTLSPAHFFLPTARTLLALAIFPALALCGIYTIIEWYFVARKRWRKGKAAL